LQFTPLEERATPAITHFLPAFPPPEVMVVAPNPQVAPPPAAEVAIPNCRTDLFAMTDGGGNDQADVWEEWFAVKEATDEVPAAKPDEVVAEGEATIVDLASTSQAVFSADAAGESGGE
jgi:hypothetical protein